MRRGRALFFAIITGAGLAGAIAAGISAFMIHRVVAERPDREGAKKIEVVPVTFLYPLGELTVNLRDPGRYLKVTIELEVLAKGKAEGHGQGKGHGEEALSLPPAAMGTKEELDEKRAKILDAVIEELSSSSFHQLLTPQGKRDLRDRLIKAVNALIETGKVQAVYFTSFLAQ